MQYARRKTRIFNVSSDETEYVKVISEAPAQLEDFPNKHARGTRCDADIRMLVKT